MLPKANSALAAYTLLFAGSLLYDGPMMALTSIILPAMDETYSLSETVSAIKKLLPDRFFQFIIITYPKYSKSFRASRIFSQI